MEIAFAVWYNVFSVGTIYKFLFRSSISRGGFIIMDFNDIAAKGARAIANNYGKKVLKKGPAPVIPKSETVSASGEGYRLGFARADINPEEFGKKTYWIAGHGSGHQMEGVLTDVFVSAVWIDVGTDEGLVWLSGDIVGLTNIEVNEIRRRIMAEPEFSKCIGINFSCTHSHSGIDTVGYWGKANALHIPSNGKDPEYMEKLFSQSVKAAKEAFVNRTPGKLYTGRHSIEGGLYTPRRLPEKHEILTRLRFVPDNGSSETWLVNVGAHPNSLGGKNRMLSAEYPHFLRERVAEKTGANVLFGIGAIGGMDAAEFDKDDRVNNIKKQGEFFADAAIAVDNDKLLEPVIKYNRRRFYLPVDNYVLLLLAMRGTMSFAPFACKESGTGVAMRTEMTYMTFGSQKILLLPGENFVCTVYGGYEPAERSSTGKGPEINPAPLAEICGDPEMIAYGVSNDMTGYVVAPNDFCLHPTQAFLNPTNDVLGGRHYHETTSMGIKTQGVIADTFARLVKDF